eukprot:scaffold17726_cov135-Skeletonema_dohrnii-CCMP3373.AAC.3
MVRRLGMHAAMFSDGRFRLIQTPLPLSKESVMKQHEAMSNDRIETILRLLYWWSMKLATSVLVVEVTSALSSGADNLYRAFPKERHLPVFQHTL